MAASPQDVYRVVTGIGAARAWYFATGLGDWGCWTASWEAPVCIEADDILMTYTSATPWISGEWKMSKPSV